MQKPVIAVYDKKVGAYEAVHIAKHPGEAIRDWENIRTNKDNKYGKNPEDFDLHQIAKFDEITGSFETLQPSLHLASGV